MSNHYLLVDDAHRTYFDCDKFLPLGPGKPDEEEGAALREHPFERWLSIVNWGGPTPETTNRYKLALPEARAMYDFLVASEWKARLVSLDNDDYDEIEESAARDTGHDGYKKVGTTYP